MSTTLLAASALADATNHPYVLAGDVIDWGNEKGIDVGNLFRGLTITISIGFVIWQAIKSHGAMSRVITSGIAAGAFIWMVFNVNTVKDMFGSEVTAAPAAVQVEPLPGPPAGTTPDRLTVTGLPT